MCSLGTRRSLLRSVIPAAWVARRAFAQAPQNPQAMAAHNKTKSEDNERKGLAEAYKGITTDGKIVPNLYPIQSTGVSTGPVREAAEKFLNLLTTDQRSRVLF